MKRSKSYIQTHDIDWFGIVNNKLMIHVASAGGMIPNRVNNIEQLATNRSIVMQLPILFDWNDLIINESAILSLFEVQKSLFLEYRGVDLPQFYYDIFKDNYLKTFIPYAQRGLLTFDKTFFKHEEQDVYHMVCRPRDVDFLKNELTSGIANFETVDLDIMMDETAQNINILDILK